MQAQRILDLSVFLFRNIIKLHILFFPGTNGKHFRRYYDHASMGKFYVYINIWTKCYHLSIKQKSQNEMSLWTPITRWYRSYDAVEEFRFLLTLLGVEDLVLRLPVSAADEFWNELLLRRRDGWLGVRVDRESRGAWESPSSSLLSRSTSLLSSSLPLSWSYSFLGLATLLAR